MEPEVLVLVFSKGRPLQLQATLETLALEVSNIGHVDVLTLDTSEEYAQVARFMRNKYKMAVRIVPQTNFYHNVLEMLNPAYSHVLFLVDDSLFFQKVNLRDCCMYLRTHQDVIGVSLRLGTNTTYCYMQKEKQIAEDVRKDETHFLTCDWTKSTGDFNYPFDISSSLYRISDIDQLLKRIRFFMNPNSMEHYMDMDRERFAHKPRLAYYPESRCFSNPMNLSQEQFKNNRHSRNGLYTIERLLHMYRAGKRMDVSPLSTIRPNSAHMEFEFSFRDKDDADK